MLLEVDTPEGQEALKLEQEAVAIWSQHYPDIEYRKMAGKTSPWDAYMVKGGKVRAVAETKSRDYGLKKLFGQYKGEWLVTLSKITDCIAEANRLNVPFVGLLHLVPDRTILFQTLWRPETPEILVPYRVENSETLAGVSSARRVTRLNAYLDMRDAKMIRGRG